MFRIATVIAAATRAAAGLVAPASAAPSAPVPAVAAHSAGLVHQVAIQKKEPAQQFKRKKVRLVTDEEAGTIIIDTNNKFLYLVQGNDRAIRYGVGVGRDGFGWSGRVKIGRKEEWPTWRPPAEMRRREAAKGHILPVVQEGGEDNPLGARAMYLYKGGRDTIFRLHGTNQPWTIGLNMSSGCIRMMNKDVEDLYSRVDIGTKVIVIGPGNKHGKVSFDDRGVDILRTLFGG